MVAVVLKRPRILTQESCMTMASIEDNSTMGKENTANVNNATTKKRAKV